MQLRSKSLNRRKFNVIKANHNLFFFLFLEILLSSIIQWLVQVSVKCSLICSLHNQRAFLLHFDETALDVPKYWFIAAVMNKIFSRISCRNFSEAKCSEHPKEKKKTNRAEENYRRARELYDCVACWSCAESRMISADNASALLCSFASWAYWKHKKKMNSKIVSLLN